MIEIVRGSTITNPVCKQKLGEYFSTRNDLNGILFFGYPIVKENTSLDALLITKEYSIIVFDLYEGNAQDYHDRTDVRDELFNVLQSMLIKNKELMKNRNPVFKVTVLTYAPSLNQIPDTLYDLSSGEVITDLKSFEDYVEEWKNPQKFDPLLSAIQVATKIKSTVSRKITHEDSKGSILKKIENSISTLDLEQNKAIIETTDGIQRIRGLAGSGKSIVLALKAAYLYSAYPNYKIVITFNTRSLKQLFNTYVTRFIWEYTGEDFDPTRLQILNSWGSLNDPGVYSEICQKCGLDYLNYEDAHYKAYMTGSTVQSVVYDSALRNIKGKEKELFDIILVDEAQDFPGSFFDLCESVISKDHGKLVIAYDELQNLKKGTSDNINNFFKSKNMNNEPGKPKKDIILPICYRTSKEILVTAHALGFGIYNSKLIQLFDKPELWEDVGYEIEEGKLEYGHRVVLCRKKTASPDIYPQATDETIICKSFPTKDDEAEWIAHCIKNNLEDDDISYRDILVIVLQNKDIDVYAGTLRSKLIDLQINSHIAGVTTNANTFYVDNSITISSIYRAKGNEASIVYIMGTNDVGTNCNAYQEMRYRNNLFTAITRSKLWVRLTGVGSIDNIANEISAVKKNNYKLNFTYPSEGEFTNMIKIYSEGEQKKKDKDLISILGKETYDSLLSKYKSSEELMKMFGHLL